MNHRKRISESGYLGNYISIKIWVFIVLFVVAISILEKAI
ncbi:MAG: hypothetical protein JETT_2838 [Candidatus Jettenia ecosi]|uniref:Uncharacterized protein n=1 Tax=Candidatus Jettenia ecosi TaxID=2494326 RepID=A0A533Q8C7_9BACT|nr:MAG: hypothetical protein JETT_2838 [Candidatus Jettenia ecosi]